MIYIILLICYICLHLNISESFIITNNIHRISSQHQLSCHFGKSKPYNNKPKPNSYKKKAIPSTPRKTTAIPTKSTSSTSSKITENIDPYSSSNHQIARNFGSKTISGENRISCRSFALDSMKTFKFEGSYADAHMVPGYGVPEIAFIGRSNVGKSSLLNMMSGLNKDIAVVSKTPGRTRLINMFKCSDKDGDICMFVDLPGYGYAKMSKEEQVKISGFLTSYLKDRGSLRMVVVLVDIRRDPQESDREIIEYLEEEGISYIVVATKCDKLSSQELFTSLQILNHEYDLPTGYPIPMSSMTGLGKRELWKVIRSGILGELFNDDDDDDDDVDIDDPIEELLR